MRYELVTAILKKAVSSQLTAPKPKPSLFYLWCRLTTVWRGLHKMILLGEDLKIQISVFEIRCCRCH